MAQDIDQLAIDTIRTLSIDAVEKANSGHPGTPMSMAPVAYELWQNHLRYDPADPVWPNRDRFVLSAGHASMLLYSMLFLAGVQRVDADYNVARRAGRSACTRSKNSASCTRARRATPSTAGPPASRRRPARSARGSPPRSGWRWPRSGRASASAPTLFDFDVYALAGDGCLMEGVSHESASLAGHLKLDNLCWIYDNNHITIDGDTALAYGDDVLSRFEGYGWNVLRVGDANDAALLARAFEEFKAEIGRPTLIVIDSHIGWGSPNKQDTESAHGEPLGEEEVEADQARLRLARGRPVPRPRRRPRALRRGDRQARRRAARRLGAEARRLRRRTAAEIEMMQHRRAARRLGRRDPLLRGRRREGPGHPQGLEQGRERDRRAGAVADRRLRRPHRLDLGPAHLRRRRQLRARQLRRPPDPLRDPRTRRRRGLQRPLALASCGRSGRPTSPSPTTAAPGSASRR